MQPEVECEFCHTDQVSLEARQASGRLARLPEQHRAALEQAFGAVPALLCAQDTLVVLQHANAWAAEVSPL